MTWRITFPFLVSESSLSGQISLDFKAFLNKEFVYLDILK